MFEVFTRNKTAGLFAVPFADKVNWNSGSCASIFYYFHYWIFYSHNLIVVAPPFLVRATWEWEHGALLEGVKCGLPRLSNLTNSEHNVWTHLLAITKHQSTRKLMPCEYHIEIKNRWKWKAYMPFGHIVLWSTMIVRVPSTYIQDAYSRYIHMQCLIHLPLFFHSCTHVYQHPTRHYTCT